MQGPGPGGPRSGWTWRSISGWDMSVEALRSIPPQPKSRCGSRLEAVRVGEKQGACSWLLQVAWR